MDDSERSYREQIRVLHRKLGIPADYENARGLPLQREAESLVSVGPDYKARERHLISEAAAAWHSLKASAAADGVEILLMSAYRSVRNQADEIQRRLDRGEKLPEILNLLAAPGFSEHHTGRAVDIVCTGIQPLDAALDQTPSFEWMVRRAAEFGFTMSYPHDNPYKIVYEPWHWCWKKMG